jgi:hypothetical protein
MAGIGATPLITFANSTAGDLIELRLFLSRKCREIQIKVLERKSN